MCGLYHWTGDNYYTYQGLHMIKQLYIYTNICNIYLAGIHPNQTTIMARFANFGDRIGGNVCLI